jgi:hypothetical protein
VGFGPTQTPDDWQGKLHLLMGGDMIYFFRSPGIGRRF